MSIGNYSTNPVLLNVYQKCNLIGDPAGGGFALNFRESLQLLAEKITDRQQYVMNKEMTNQLLVVPFLEVLGFDVLDPRDAITDYTDDIGRAKSQKIDYAIKKNGRIKIFIEVNPANTPLKNHSPLLARFFNAGSEVRFAILTNGVEYKLFTDFNKKNVMDEMSFIDINIANLTDSAMEVLSKIRKDELY